jgi:hypothetical protein
VVVQARPACTAPTPPDYAAIDPSAAEAAAWETLLENLTRQCQYVGELEATIECYEAGLSVTVRVAE